MLTEYLAQSSGGGVSDVFLQTGSIGAIALVLLGVVRVLFARETKTLDRERERGDRLEAELRALNTSIHERYVPILTQATGAIAAALKQVARRDEG